MNIFHLVLRMKEVKDFHPLIQNVIFNHSGFIMSCFICLKVQKNKDILLIINFKQNIFWVLGIFCYYIILSCT